MRYNGLLMTHILYSVHTDLDLKKQRGRYFYFFQITLLLKNIHLYKNYALCLKQPVHLVRQPLFNRTDGTKRTNINGHQYQERKKTSEKKQKSYYFYWGHKNIFSEILCITETT
jgi:hypothetical protein